MNKRLFILITAVATILFLAGAAALAQGARTPVFISPDQLDAASILLTPPANDSIQTRNELAELHHLEESRSKADVIQAQKDDVEEDIFVFNDVIGAKFTRESLPLTTLLSDHVHSDESVIVNPAKSFFQRPRPYQLDKTLKPVCKVNANTTDYAYPGGHGTTGYLEAMVLALIVPEKRDAIFARADEYAHNRLVCGVLYATDIVASKHVAYAMMGIIINNPQFRRELAAAKTETRSALGLQSSN